MLLAGPLRKAGCIGRSWRCDLSHIFPVTEPGYDQDENIDGGGFRWQRPTTSDIIEDCFRCTFREHRLFCDLSPKTVAKLQSIKATSVYPKNDSALPGRKDRAWNLLFVHRHGQALDNFL